MKKSISVVIPAHNEENVIVKSISSVLSSSRKDFEIIVVNDGSTDGTEKIVRNFMRKHPEKIKIISYDRGHSPAFSRNRGAEAATGEFVFFLDADDWIREDTLENIVLAFRKHKEIDFIVGNRKTVVPGNWRRIFIYGVIARKETELNLGVAGANELVTIEKNTACPYIVRNRKFRDFGGFDENRYYTEDFMFSEKLKNNEIPKLLTNSVVYYSDLRSTWRDFTRQCRNVAKSFRMPLDYVKIVGFLLETSISVVCFMPFSVLMSLYILYRTRDPLLALSSPFLYMTRRIIELIYLIRRAP